MSAKTLSVRSNRTKARNRAFPHLYPPGNAISTPIGIGTYQFYGKAPESGIALLWCGQYATRTISKTPLIRQSRPGISGSGSIDKTKAVAFKTLKCICQGKPGNRVGPNIHSTHGRVYTTGIGAFPEPNPILPRISIDMGIQRVYRIKNASITGNNPGLQRTGPDSRL